MSIRKKLTKKVAKLQLSFAEKRGFKERLENIAHLLTGNILSSFIGLAGFALTARALGPAGYGVLALCFSYTRAIERLVSFQSWQPLIKYGAAAEQAEDSTELQALLKFGLLLDISAAVGGWLIAVLLALSASRLLGISDEMVSLVVFYCTILPFHISGMPTAVLRLFGRFTWLAYGQVTSSIVRVALCAVGVATGAGLFEFAVIWMVAQLVGTLTLTGFALAELHKRRLLAGLISAPLRGIRKRFPGIWKFAISANLSLTIRASANEVDTLLVGYLADPASAGLYHIAKRIGRIAQQAGVQVQAVLYPELARSWASNAFREFHRTVTQMQGLLFAFGVALIGGLYLFIGPLLRWAAGPDFLGAVPLVLVQSVAVMMTLCGTVIRSALLAMGREQQILNSVLISTLFFHATAFLLIPSIGAMGANVAHIVMATIWLSTMMVAYRRTPAQ